MVTRATYGSLAARYGSMRRKEVRLPGSWREFAACLHLDPTLFVGVEDENYLDKRRRENYAKSICTQCPVEETCLQHALANDETGIWGGTNRIERNKMLGKRRSRP